MELSDNHEPSSRRETMLTIMLTALAGGGFLIFLIFVSGGFFFYVGLVVAGIAAVGYLHYLAWGQAMSSEVEQAQAFEAAFEEDLPVRRAPRRGNHRRRRF